MIVYVETNFLMSIAKGQDEQAENLLQHTPTSLRLAVPSICYSEALTTLEQEEKYNKDFLNRLNIQISESERDKTSQNAQLLRTLLDQARVSFNQRISDGQPLTTDDVVFSYNEIYFNKDIPTAIKDLVKIGENDTFPKVQKLSARQVEFTLPEPFAPFLRNAAVAILPAHALHESIITKDSEGRPQFLTKWGTDTHPEKIICNGPYRMVNYATSERIMFERNPYYWRNDDQGNPMPYIQRVIWQLENK